MDTATEAEGLTESERGMLRHCRQWVPELRDRIAYHERLIAYHTHERDQAARVLPGWTAELERLEARAPAWMREESDR